MPPIRIQGLTKTYKDGPRAVDNVDLETRDGGARRPIGLRQVDDARRHRRAGRGPDPRRLFARPANLFVAAFIGSPALSLVEADVNGREARFGASRLALPATGAALELAIEPARPHGFDPDAGTAIELDGAPVSGQALA